MKGKDNPRSYGLRQPQLSRFCRFVLGISARKNTSLYDLTVEALAKSGFPKPSTVSAKLFIIKHCEFILSRQASKSGAKKAHARFVEKCGPVKIFKPEVSYSDSIHPATDAFLQSYEWRRARMVALKKHGARCQCCGATPNDGVKMHVDHIKPRRLFPQLALDQDNLQVLCEVCNHGKGNWDMTDWRPAEKSEAEKDALAHLKSI